MAGCDGTQTHSWKVDLQYRTCTNTGHLRHGGSREALRWDSRVRNWTQVPGVILKNEQVETSYQKSKSTISKIEYEYHFKEQRYTGNRILYDRDYYPTSARPGTKCRILVIPANPADSAAMIWYRSHWSLIRYA